MASPFPGMDPYLEEPGDWSGVHGRLIGSIGEMLARQVSPHFFVASETSVYVVTPDDLGRRLVRPDLYLVEAASIIQDHPSAGTITMPVRITPHYPLEIHQHYLEIRDRAHRQVVTTIEVLSPVNKAADSKGQADFLRKRGQVMASRTHWLEIDLLRAGARPDDVAISSDYYALLKRGDATDEWELWPFNLRDRLPTIAVPLLAPLPDVPLDLAEAVATVVQRYHYDDWLDYTAPPPPPALDAADSLWGATCIRQWRAASAQ